MSWFSAAARIATLIAVAAVIGWYYGYPLAAVAAALLCLVVFWLYQLSRVQAWLDNPTRPPPDISGLWGDLLARIYFHQRNSKKAQEQLEASVTYLRSSFASMRDGVVMVDEHGAIEWLNRAVQPLLGLRFPTDLGQPLTNLVRSPEFNLYFSEGDYDEPLLYCTNDEKKSFLRVEVTRFGEAERLLFVRDVTASMRTDQVRRDFVANVSHELRTPLTVLSGYLGTFLDDPAALPEPYVRAVQQMEQQAQRMENLLKDLLWLSRIESDIREEKMELLDIAALLAELREELCGTHPQTQLQLHLETDHKVRGDYREVYSAVSNLVLNAIKYSPPQSLVSVRWYGESNDLRLAVTDQGVGIDPIHFPRLTERFYRVDDSRSSATGGTGLGLAIVKHVAAAHGASLQIESEPGKGSTFTLVFSEGA